MLMSEGYKMFRGTATIVPTNPKWGPEDITGDWLYKPEWDCWYVGGWSYPACIVENIREEQDEVLAELKAKIAAIGDLAANEDNITEVVATISRLCREYC